MSWSTYFINLESYKEHEIQEILNTILKIRLCKLSISLLTITFYDSLKARYYQADYTTINPFTKYF